jgi:hypothetical protein
MVSSKSMVYYVSLLASLLAPAVLLSTPALAAPASSPAGKPAAGGHSLYQSRELWATIDVCNPKDQPNTVGIRGSMPGDGQLHDTMYMRFRLQYLDDATKHWVDVPLEKKAEFHRVGAAGSARQGGHEFVLGAPVPGKPGFTFRGVVSFQWRRGSTVEHTVSRPTTAGHESLAGADPAGFSAAGCSLP